MVCLVPPVFLQYRWEYCEMSITETVKENLAYSKELLESGIEGANEARKAALAAEENSNLVTVAAQESWQPATVGVLAGAIFGVLADDRKPLRGVITGGLLGAVLGFAGSFAWKTRPLTSAMSRGAGKRIGRAIALELARVGARIIVHVNHSLAEGRETASEIESLGARAAVIQADQRDTAAIEPVAAEARALNYLDATCPLVSKVHRQAERMVEAGRHVLFIGHAGHPEVIGTFGQVGPGAMTLVETIDDARAVQVADPAKLAFLTQTTLSVDDTAEIVAELQRRFPGIIGPKGEDICYATSNRQAAVKAITARCDLMLVIGATNSSNSLRLREVAERDGVAAHLIARADVLDWAWFEGVHSVGITAGASAPEVLVQELLALLGTRYRLEIEEVASAVEDVVFKLPRALPGCGRFR